MNKTKTHRKKRYSRMKQPKGGAGSSKKGKTGKKGKEHPNPHIIKKTFNMGVVFEGQSLNEDDTYLIGILKDPQMGLTYEGTVFVDPLGNSYLHGTGKIVWDNGMTYEGQLDMSKKHGYGILNNGNSVYYGDFRNDIADGYGRLETVTPDGTVKTLQGPVIQDSDGMYLFLEEPMPPLEVAPGVHPTAKMTSDVAQSHRRYNLQKTLDSIQFSRALTNARSGMY